MPRVRGAGGEFIETVSVDEVLAVLTDENEPLTTTEIANYLGVSSRTALNKLNELHEENPIVKRKEVGANGVIWYIKHGAIHEQAFEAFAEQLTDEVGELIDEIVLYGSVARGEAREESDVDVLIVIEDEEHRETVQERASQISWDVMMEVGPVISKIIMTTDEMAERESPFTRNVEADGVVYA